MQKILIVSPKAISSQNFEGAQGRIFDIAKFLSKKNKIDFFIKIEPRLSLEEKQQFIEKLNKISKILLIFELDLKKEEEAHRFIFYD